MTDSHKQHRCRRILIENENIIKIALYNFS